MNQSCFLVADYDQSVFTNRFIIVIAHSMANHSSISITFFFSHLLTFFRHQERVRWCERTTPTSPLRFVTQTTLPFPCTSISSTLIFFFFVLLFLSLQISKERLNLEDLRKELGGAQATPPQQKRLVETAKKVACAATLFFRFGSLGPADRPSHLGDDSPHRGHQCAPHRRGE